MTLSRGRSKAYERNLRTEAQAEAAGTPIWWLDVTGAQLTRRQLAALYGCSYEGIRLTELRALRKLRSGFDGDH